MDVKGWWFVKYSRILAHPEKGMPPLGESCLQGRHGTLSGGPWNLRGGLLHRGTPSSPWVTIGAELWWLVDFPWLRKPLSIRRRSLFAPLPTPTPLPCPNLWGYFTMFVIATSFSVHLWGRPQHTLQVAEIRWTGYRGAQIWSTSQLKNMGYDQVAWQRRPDMH